MLQEYEWLIPPLRTGSDHVREKDGIWAVLAWLAILAHKDKDNLSGEKLVVLKILFANVGPPVAMIMRGVCKTENRLTGFSVQKNSKP